MFYGTSNIPHNNPDMLSTFNMNNIMTIVPYLLKIALSLPVYMHMFQM